MIGPNRTRPVLLDACCVLNLFATGRVEEILRGIPLDFAAAERVVAEAMFVRRGGIEEDANETEAVDLALVVSGGLVHTLSVDTEAEASSYVAFAAQLDDGEAMTCALAMHRDYTVATDDRKALRLLRSILPADRILTTPGLIKLWVDECSIPHMILRETLLNIRERARFLPGRHDPLKEWWESFLTGN